MAKKAKGKTEGGFLKKLASKVKNASIMEDAVGSAEFTGTIDTGCLMLNALVSGSVRGGIQNNKTIALAGDPSTGKTFFALSILKHFLLSHTEAVGVEYDTEQAITKKMMTDRGIPADRVMLVEPVTIQDFKENVLDITDEINTSKDDVPPMMMILDSLGQLSTNKEQANSRDPKKKDVKDMTRPGLVKEAFRMIRYGLARAKIPMIVTNHVYANVGGYGPKKTISGGSGLLYTADTILMLSKAKQETKNKGFSISGKKQEKEYSGVLITVTAYKSRLTRENKSIVCYVDYNTGLDRYYGLIRLALKYGIFTQEGKHIVLPDGKKVFPSAIQADPETYYTTEVLDRLDEAAKTEFCYGAGEGPRPVEEIEEDSDEITFEDQESEFDEETNQ
jgi:RecA/RadA recombinase